MKEVAIGDFPGGGIEEWSDVPSFGGGLGDGVFKSSKNTEEGLCELRGGGGVPGLKEHEERASEVVIVSSVFEFGDIGGLE